MESFTAYKRVLHVFRRDLRLDDNTALIAAAAAGDVVPCFFLDPRQTDDHPYRSLPGLRFLRDSLDDLAEHIMKLGGRLHVISGKAEDSLERILKHESIDAVFCNRDYTPFALRRDAAMRKTCAEHGRGFHLYGDALLHEPEEIRTGAGTPYTVFGAFHRTASALPVRHPSAMPQVRFGRLANVPHEPGPPRLMGQGAPDATAKGGRSEALTLLKRMSSLRRYDAERNLPAADGTTRLSAHLKFGTCSVREAALAAKSAAGSLMQELYWRDFFTHVAFHNPRVFDGPFRKEYAGMRWNGNAEDLRMWENGETGFPIVDAGMRELRATGFMHNRIRMVTASFLVKDLHIDWRDGERHFARCLTDYDPCVNNGNWQWAASTGCDAVPYFRIFNPWLQQKRFDPDCAYIKRWIPELRSLPAAAIHGWQKKQWADIAYPPPMCDHAKEAAAAKAMFARR